jgi:hypothetical protein
LAKNRRGRDEEDVDVPLSALEPERHPRLNIF